MSIPLHSVPHVKAAFVSVALWPDFPSNHPCSLLLLLHPPPIPSFHILYSGTRENEAIPDLGVDRRVAAAVANVAHLLTRRVALVPDHDKRHLSRLASKL